MPSSQSNPSQSGPSPDPKSQPGGDLYKVGAWADEKPKQVSKKAHKITASVPRPSVALQRWYAETPEDEPWSQVQQP
ncbi:MAG: hypothetical protein M1816_003544 [Peltula sp. TS41687]|nr:MAG: hypothetical protein M1816_003544 [Peltula sp. TS41687]